MKKVLSLFLSLVMLLTITSGLDFSSYAITPYDLYNEFVSNEAEFNLNVSLNDENNNGIFNCIIYDFDNDGNDELVTAEIWHRIDPYLVFCLYRIENNEVRYQDTSVRININGYGNYSVNICAKLVENSINLQKNLISNGGSLSTQDYYNILIENDGFNLKRHYLSYEYPRYDRYEYTEDVSGKVYNSYNEFMNSIDQNNLKICNHNDFDYVNGDYTKYEGFKGNHIFSLYNDFNFNSVGDTGFVYSNKIQIKDVSFNQHFSNVGTI